jgi:hypothetical protein
MKRIFYILLLPIAITLTSCYCDTRHCGDSSVLIQVTFKESNGFKASQIDTIKVYNYYPADTTKPLDSTFYFSQNHETVSYIFKNLPNDASNANWTKILLSDTTGYYWHKNFIVSSQTVKCGSYCHGEEVASMSFDFNNKHYSSPTYLIEPVK